MEMHGATVTLTILIESLLCKKILSLIDSNVDRMSTVGVLSANCLSSSSSVRWLLSQTLNDWRLTQSQHISGSDHITSHHYEPCLVRTGAGDTGPDEPFSSLSPLSFGLNNPQLLFTFRTVYSIYYNRRHDLFVIPTVLLSFHKRKWQIMHLKLILWLLKLLKPNPNTFFKMCFKLFSVTLALDTLIFRLKMGRGVNPGSENS